MVQTGRRLRRNVSPVGVGGERGGHRRGRTRWEGKTTGRSRAWRRELGGMGDPTFLIFPFLPSHGSPCSDSLALSCPSPSPRTLIHSRLLAPPNTRSQCHRSLTAARIGDRRVRARRRRRRPRRRRTFSSRAESPPTVDRAKARAASSTPIRCSTTSFESSFRSQSSCFASSRRRWSPSSSLSWSSGCLSRPLDRRRSAPLWLRRRRGSNSLDPVKRERVCLCVCLEREVEVWWVREDEGESRKMKKKKGEV